MVRLKSVAIIVLLLYLLSVPRSFAQNTQWPGWPAPGAGIGIDTTAGQSQNTQWPEWPTPGELERAARADEDVRRVQQEADLAAEEARRNSLGSLEWAWRDPTPEEEEAKRQAALLAAEKNYTEMMEGALELAAFSQRISDEIHVNGPHVISKRMLKDLEKLEKLAKKVRNRGKRLPTK